MTTRRTPLRGATVLVVEDDQDHRELADQMLTALGARVLVAEDGREALQVLDTESVSLVLCDVLMPMIDGLEFARRVRASPRHQHLRLVAVTALNRPSDFRRTRAAGFDAHLAKPFTLEQLEDLVRLIGPAAPDTPQAPPVGQPPP